MKVVVSQKGKKILIKFYQGKVVDNYIIDKADDFLSAIDRVVKLWQRRQRRHLQSGPKFYYQVDKFLKRRNNSLASVFNANLDFINVGMLTERIIRAIIAGLRF